MKNVRNSLGSTTTLLALFLLACLSRVLPSQTESPYRNPQQAELSLQVADGLQVTTFAAEPNIVSISNIDVDHRGRVWVCEAVNYRGNNGKRPDGDRILILEDTDRDGRSDITTVFYQGRDIDIPMGLCVLGNKAIVAVSPEILLLEDTDGDDKADKKTVLFKSDAEFQHDHSLHSFVFGPDGRFYGNFGNTGNALKDPDGNPMIDIAKRKVVADGKPYWGGMVFRCDRDFKNVEVIGHNFRNNYEATVDSFANVWQSDNDDDGNLAVRFNYILEGGNYGYLDEMTGESWQKRRIGEHADRWMRHWHQNDPGSVPNVLLTGNGAPAGITIYEGRLLPQMFWGQAIHCDAGPHSVHAFPTHAIGAGFTASVAQILNSDDPNFRPIDVAVAPDGSLFVSDWHDPVVGGFKQDDIERGRIYWMAPSGHKYAPPKYDLESVDGLVKTLKSPNFCARYLAWTKLHEMQADAETSLKMMLKEKDSRLRARALWLLAQIKGKEEEYIKLALADGDEQIRIVGLRLARMLMRNSLPTISGLTQDPSPRVRAELAVQLRFHNNPSAGRAWAKLAKQYDGQDRWYLEALGIGASNNWNHCLTQWLNMEPEWNTDRGRDIIWRSRADTTPLLLAKIIASESTNERNPDRYIRAFDFQSSASKDKAMELLLFGKIDGRQVPLDSHTSVAVANRLLPENVKAKRVGLQPLIDLLQTAKVSDSYLQLVDRYDLREFYPAVLGCVQSHDDDDLRTQAIRLLLEKQQIALIQNSLRNAEQREAQATFDALAGSYHEGSIELILMAVISEGSTERFDRESMRTAVRQLAEFPEGATRLLDLAEDGYLADDLKSAVAAHLLTNRIEQIRNRAVGLFPVSSAKDEKPLPDLRELIELRGDPENGKLVFQNQGKCASCHVPADGKQMVGPDLGKIGDKLGRAALYESILYPIEVINKNNETYSLTLTSGRVVAGIMVNQNAEEIAIRLEDGSTKTFKKSEIDEVIRSNVSLMPADLHKLMTVNELADVVAYMTTLKEK